MATYLVHYIRQGYQHVAYRVTAESKEQAEDVLDEQDWPEDEDEWEVTDGWIETVEEYVETHKPTSQGRGYE
jgi:hypothetical protein